MTQLDQILANQARILAWFPVLSKTIAANQAQNLRWFQLIDQVALPNNQTQLLNWLKLIASQEKSMADILDTVLADVQQAATDMAALSTDIQTIIADLQAVQPTGISPNDPRFQQLITSLQGVDAGITKGASDISAALPPAPTPTPAPAPAAAKP